MDWCLHCQHNAWSFLVGFPVWAPHRRSITISKLLKNLSHQIFTLFTMKGESRLVEAEVEVEVLVELEVEVLVAVEVEVAVEVGVEVEVAVEVDCRTRCF